MKFAAIKAITDWIDAELATGAEPMALIGELTAALMSVPM